MKVHKMTKWDAGQDLIACADFLGEKEEDLIAGGYHDEAMVIRQARWSIGSAFNRLKSHVFGLADGETPPQKPRK